MQTDCFNMYYSLSQQPNATSIGLSLYPMTEYLDIPSVDDLWYKTLMPNFTAIEPQLLPSGVNSGAKYTTLCINPLLFLPWLQNELVKKGVNFIRKQVSSFEEARQVAGVAESAIVVNASGVGARELANDNSVYPIRGQTIFVKTPFAECIMNDGKDYTYVIPRAGSGGVILGGVKSSRTDVEVDEALKGDIFNRVNRLSEGAFNEEQRYMTQMEERGEVKHLVGFRPGRIGGVRVEREERVVHAYGVGGQGYIYSFGVALEVERLVVGMGRESRL